jgi:hypothetical protein
VVNSELSSLVPSSGAVSLIADEEDGRILDKNDVLRGRRGVDILMSPCQDSDVWQGPGNDTGPYNPYNTR